MKRPKVKDYTFQEGKNLFKEDVIMIFRNSDKQHIISIGKEHVKEMIDLGYNYVEKQEILEYLQRAKKMI